MWMWRFLLPFSLCSWSFRSEIILECNFISTISIWQLLWQALIFFCLVGGAMFSIKNCNWNWIGKSHLKVPAGLVKPYFINSFTSAMIFYKSTLIFLLLLNHIWRKAFVFAWNSQLFLIACELLVLLLMFLAAVSRTLEL